MLTECTKSDFEKYADLAYGLAMDPSRSGYPTYRDGIKTRAMFEERILKAFGRDDEEVLLFADGGEVRGLIHYFSIPDDRYLQTNAFCVHGAADQALSEFISYVRGRFKGYDLYMGFPAENRDAAEYLSGHGYECIEDDYNNTAFLDGPVQMPEPAGMIKIGRDNYGSFRSLHDQVDGDMYWNSDRIYEDLDGWTVLVKEKDGKPEGAVYYKNADDGWYEIFGIDADGGEPHPDLFRDLLRAALSDIRRRGGRFVTFFCEKEYEEYAQECGFVCVGNYLCFKVRLD